MAQRYPKDISGPIATRCAVRDLDSRGDAAAKPPAVLPEDPLGAPRLARRSGREGLTAGAFGAEQRTSRLSPDLTRRTPFLSGFHPATGALGSRLAAAGGVEAVARHGLAASRTALSNCTASPRTCRPD
jgi:hypothetical protein